MMDNAVEMQFVAPKITDVQFFIWRENRKFDHHLERGAVLFFGSLLELRRTIFKDLRAAGQHVAIKLTYQLAQNEKEIYCSLRPEGGYATFFSKLENDIQQYEQDGCSLFIYKIDKPELLRQVGNNILHNLADILLDLTTEPMNHNVAFQRIITNGETAFMDQDRIWRRDMAAATFGKVTIKMSVPCSRHAFYLRGSKHRYNCVSFATRLLKKNKHATSDDAKLKTIGFNRKGHGCFSVSLLFPIITVGVIALLILPAILGLGSGAAGVFILNRLDWFRYGEESLDASEEFYGLGTGLIIGAIAFTLLFTVLGFIVTCLTCITCCIQGIPCVANTQNVEGFFQSLRRRDSDEESALYGDASRLYFFGKQSYRLGRIGYKKVVQRDPVLESQVQQGEHVQPSDNYFTMEEDASDIENSR